MSHKLRGSDGARPGHAGHGAAQHHPSDDHTVLEPGMVISTEPGLTVGDVHCTSGRTSTSSPRTATSSSRWRRRAAGDPVLGSRAPGPFAGEGQGLRSQVGVPAGAPEATARSLLVSRSVTACWPAGAARCCGRWRPTPARSLATQRAASHPPEDDVPPGTECRIHHHRARWTGWRRGT